MNRPAFLGGIREWIVSGLRGWDRFWFQPELPHTLAILRIATGAMLLYTHLVLATDLESFLGPNAWVNGQLAREIHDGTYGPPESVWSYLWSMDSMGLLWIHQGIAIVLAICMMIGLLTRITAPLTWFIQLMFVHRLTGALFGLDQVTTMMAFYLMLAPCGSVYSVDAWLRKRRLGEQEGSGVDERSLWALIFPAARASTMVRVATRLAQVHLCIIYLFGGLWKARGEMWWDGTALWFAAVNLEYQSNDLTWISRYPVLFAGLTHITVFWETFYCALVWPRWTRPLVLVTAVMVHGGIAIFLGMITFGTMMIIANGVFVFPETTRSIIDMVFRRRSSLEE